MVINKHRRFIAQLEALGSVVDTNGKPLLSDREIEEKIEKMEQLVDSLDQQEKLDIPDGILTAAFHLLGTTYNLPQFTRRLRSFKAERIL